MNYLELLPTLTDAQLAAIYVSTIGYDPFEDGATREQVLEVLVSYPSEDPNGLVIPEGVYFGV